MRRLEFDKRIDLPDTDFAVVLEAVTSTRTFRVHGVMSPIQAVPVQFDHLLKKLNALRERKPLLHWRASAVDGVACENAWEALLGTVEDGAVFRVGYFPTCYRRGKWRLMIDVLSGENHHSWGCFDEADQPLRNFHSPANLREEAEAIAAVLLADRMERGPIKDWIQPKESK